MSKDTCVWEGFSKAFPTILEDVYGVGHTPDMEMTVVYAHTFVLLKFIHIDKDSIKVSDIRYRFDVEKQRFDPFTPTLLGDKEFKDIACTLYERYVSVATIAEILDTTTTNIYKAMNKCKV